jgi:hypothetical protein
MRSYLQVRRLSTELAPIGWLSTLCGLPFLGRRSPHVGYAVLCVVLAGALLDTGSFLSCLSESVSCALLGVQLMIVSFAGFIKMVIFVGFWLKP